MIYEEICKLHFQLLKIYEKNETNPTPYQTEINNFNRQLNLFSEDIVQRIFVLNQIIKIYERMSGNQK
ncbi:hypothetical protein SAMN05421578_1366 [Paenibacillus macquariensis]|uniref:Spo0E like sporulation regulatory protein n=1 Tax=Paenibacillus macquariensis TaxID=948756 RepID=A0ABY1KE75_9BACL|nr:hypothetical protein SAMN05421578_1366 [Paenibacillus macquariensis]